MPVTKISDLLPIPDGAKTPHAYQVFGLEGGEQDGEKIKAAVQEVYRRLKESKADTDPDLWRTAAKLVDKARSILSDPQQRAALDARFGVIQFDDAPDGYVSPPADFLAEFLPSTNPLASDPLGSVVPAGDPMAAASPLSTNVGMAPMGFAPTAPNQISPPVPQVPGTAVEELPKASPPAPAAAAKHPVVLKPKKASKRRRKSGLAIAFFGLFMIGMLGIIGMLLHFLLYGPGQLAVTSRDGQISISTQPQPSTPSVDDPIASTSPRRVNKDPVLGPVPRGPARPGDSLAGASPLANPNAATAGQMTNPPPLPVQTPTEPPATPPGPESPKPTETTPANPPETDPASPTTAPTTAKTAAMLPVKPGQQASPATEMTAEMIAAADTAIASVEKLIQQADWEKMKPAAEKVTEMTLSDEQRNYAEALYHLADLATFYRGGIVRGMSTLKAASTFELTEGVTVLVVETSADEITIRRSARNYSYRLDDMPFVLSERLSAFALSPDKPDHIAARSCFQSIAPKSNAEYRKDAVSWLEFVNDDVQGVDTAEVAKAIKKLFPD